MASVRRGQIVRGPSPISLLRVFFSRPGETELISFTIRPEQERFPEISVRIKFLTMSRQDFYDEGTVFLIVGEIESTWAHLRPEHEQWLKERCATWNEDWGFVGKQIAFRYRPEKRTGEAVIPRWKFFSRDMNAMLEGSDGWAEQLFSGIYSSSDHNRDSSVISDR